MPYRSLAFIYFENRPSGWTHSVIEQIQKRNVIAEVFHESAFSRFDFYDFIILTEPGTKAGKYLRDKLALYQGSNKILTLPKVANPCNAAYEILESIHTPAHPQIFGAFQPVWNKTEPLLLGTTLGTVFQYQKPTLEEIGFRMVNPFPTQDRYFVLFSLFSKNKREELVRRIFSSAMIQDGVFLRLQLDQPLFKTLHSTYYAVFKVLQARETNPLTMYMSDHVGEYETVIDGVKSIQSPCFYAF